jgi:hypothetical protein
VATKEIQIGLKLVGDISGISDVKAAILDLAKYGSQVQEGILATETQRINDLKEALKSIQADFEAINAEIEDGRGLENFLRLAQTEFKLAFDQTWDGMWSGAGKSLSDTLGDSVVAGLRGGFDGAGDAWEKGLDKLAQIGEQSMAKLVSRFAGNLFDSLGSSVLDNVLKPLGDSLGITSFLKDSLGSVTSFAASAGSALAGWLGIAPAAGGAAAA